MIKSRLPLNELVEEYTANSKIINKANEELLSSGRGCSNKKLKASLELSKLLHKKQLEKLEVLDNGFVGDLEAFMHDNYAHLSIKETNYKVIERSRVVFVSSLGRFENTIATIEDSLNFNKSIMIAKASIAIAILSIIVSFFSR
ncbi:hypothetical protein [uncultured Vibrio sp.]|uniref:hypothetical protein n=1 Tax=uncultured Vibrio sp. TaxID=114054 RepID=UPI00260A7892|nr:hypothetical protein [uncultured Vibrio sp.]